MLQSELHRLCLQLLRPNQRCPPLLWQASAVQSELRGISEAEV